MRRLRALFTALVFLTSLAGCGHESAPGWRLSEGEREEGGCESDTDCGPDAYCHEPSDCTSPTYCADGEPPYSAAPPYLACTCDGRFTSVSAGYPGRHAWAAPGAFGTDAYAPNCDPGAEFPLLFTFQLSLSEDRPDPLTARISTNEAPDPVEVAIPETGELTLEMLDDPIVEPWILLLHDADGTGTCTEGDSVYIGNLDDRRIDLSTFVLKADVRLQETPDPCERW